ncbi:MAG: hypothetical protein ABF768_03570 [Leuconostoc falkenbergense]|uniref:hypothetical protein n=1 Tax=Leuconostoc falkenbergense TaxID=2766470 RepID=UPI0021AA155A|nr:hypothetical protein [Leuconostoc falkenbergense]MCT4405339.1 hypothetical protein [Leuconostoc falkenbergense]
MTNIIIDLLKVLIIVTTIGTVISFYPARASFTNAQKTWIMLLLLVALLFMVFELVSGGALEFINHFFERIDEMTH